eukprot:TRINITY_DN2771_c0_g1_i3.p1 TRINITY_DN2771_c0_g1~~TRINITY_DN2771_c0_g1_i3.p1  ORF type:complete len:256 (+),score=53.29 TRINITY_DN2771_c0_g1_i3:258-1025(+)
MAAEVEGAGGDGWGHVGTRLWVGNLPVGSVWQDLKGVMEQVGPVRRADVYHGYGIVEFESRDSAIEAIKTLNNADFQGSRMFIREDRRMGGGGGGGAPRERGGDAGGYGGPRRERAPYRSYDRDGEGDSSSRGAPRAGGSGGDSSRGRGGVALFVGNLPYSTRWQDLKDHFAPYGSVTHADILMGPDGRSKGCGIVKFISEQDAQNAIGMSSPNRDRDRIIIIRRDMVNSLCVDALNGTMMGERAMSVRLDRYAR